MAAPPATDHANSFQAVAMRVTKLTATGAAMTADGSSWITSQFISVSFTPTYAAGADLVQLAADGTVCADFKSPDMVRYAALTVAICNPEPELRALMGGGVLYTPAGPPGPVTGYGAPLPGSIPEPNGVSIECWSRAIVNGHPASVNPFWYWVFPFCQIWPTGQTMIENALPAFQFSGYGYGSATWAAVDNAWPFLPADRAYQFARAATVPAITQGFAP